MNSNISNNNFSHFLYDEIKRGHTSYGSCPECNQPNTGENWCKKCYSKKFQQNFKCWTSKNEYIDKFIQESQINARNRFELLEWVPYDRLRNVSYLANGECDTVYRVTWLDGWIMHWDYEERDWKRLVDKQGYKEANNPEIHGYQVALKISSKFDENKLNEWKLHLQCQREALSNNTSLIPLLGITQDPYTLNYMIIMPNASLGNLRNNLSIKKENPNDKFYNLWDISKQLEAIHKLNLVHGNFYSENLLCATHDSIVISDFRLCRLANQPNINNDIYELLPHFAPEVLNDKLYTKAADIYSFGILMWEMTSGVPAFHICKGDRPEIIEGTIPEYIELMKRCWDNDPEKRPTANELINIFCKWSKKYPMERNDEKRIPASVRTESYGLPDTKMTLAESEVRTSDFDLSSKKKFGKKIMLQKVKNKPITIRLPKPMDTNANTDTDYRRRIDSILGLCKKATNHHVDLVKDLKQGRSFPYATRIFKETSSSLHKPNFQKDKLGRGKKDRL